MYHLKFYTEKATRPHIKWLADFANVFGCEAVVVPVEPTVPEIFGSTETHKTSEACSSLH